MNVDYFLRTYFAALDRREAPRCVSAEATVRGGYEAAQKADAGFAWASGLMGRLESSGRLTRPQRAALRGYYLALTPEHIALIRMRSPGEACGRVAGSVHVPAGTSPPDAADLQSYVSWSAMGRALGVRAKDAKRLWSDGRGAVAEELAARYARGDVEDVDEVA